MNGASTDRIRSILGANSRIVAFVISLILALDIIVAVRHEPDRTLVKGRHLTSQTPGGQPGASIGNGGNQQPSTIPGATLTASPVPGDTNVPVVGKPGTKIAGLGTIPFGVTDTDIRIAYYWKGDRTMTSPYLGPSGQKGAVDEADAFRHFVDYVNAHPNGDATFMGFPFNLHGRKLSYIWKSKVDNKASEKIFDAGQYPSTFGAAAQNIIDAEPFTAISSHGGLSDYICNDLYKAHIFNISTYDLGRYAGGLWKGTNGYCLPQGLAFEQQVDLSVSWLAHQAKTTKYQETPASDPINRVYGILYADYPGLRGSVARLKKRLIANGVNVVTEFRLPPGLTDAAQVAPDAVAHMKGHHVNTIIAPDSGAPITFTHAAAGQFSPDYYVWPCSGEDAVGQVRLYDTAQWARAEGLSCYDENWNLDLTLDDNARATQWFHQYREVDDHNSDPPSSSPLVYASFLPLLAGITNAGHALTVERFRAGMFAFRYPKGVVRYDAINGPTADKTHFMIGLGEPDASQIGDVAYVKWSNAEHTSGNTNTGNYLYSKERYTAGWVF